jgi:hypothetical protein
MVGPANERVRTTQFRQREVVQADPWFSISTGWDNIDRTNWDTVTAGGGSVDPGTGGLYELTVSAAEGDLAVLRTRDRVGYVPSMSSLFGWAFLADNLLAVDQRLRMGVTTTRDWQNAYRWEITGTPGDAPSDHYLQIIKNGTTNISIHRDRWASDPSVFGWDETVGAIVRNELGWYDFGEWKPEVQIPDLLDNTSNSIIDLNLNPDPNVSKVTLPLDRLSPVSETATDKVNFRMRCELENTGPDASAATVRFGNAHYNILGQNDATPRYKDVGRTGDIGGGDITTTQPYPLIAVRTADRDVPMSLEGIMTIPGSEDVHVSAYMMRKPDVAFVNGAEQDMTPPPGLDTREAFFEDTEWGNIDSVTRFDAAGSGNNDPHVGTKGYPVGRKLAGRSMQGGSGLNEAGASTGLDANAQLNDLDYLVLMAQASSTDNISLKALDYKIAVDR